MRTCIWRTRRRQDAEHPNTSSPRPLPSARDFQQPPQETVFIHPHTPSPITSTTGANHTRLGYRPGKWDIETIQGLKARHHPPDNPERAPYVGLSPLGFHFHGNTQAAVLGSHSVRRWRGRKAARTGSSESFLQCRSTSGQRWRGRKEGNAESPNRREPNRLFSASPTLCARFSPAPAANGKPIGCADGAVGNRPNLTSQMPAERNRTRDNLCSLCLLLFQFPFGSVQTRAPWGPFHFCGVYKK